MNDALVKQLGSVERQYCRNAQYSCREWVEVVSKVQYRDRVLLPTIRPLFSCSSGFRFAFIMSILLKCGDTESYPGPRRCDSCYNFSKCHWNLNNMTAHNFEKTNLLEAYNTINNFDVICLLESYFDWSMASDNNDLNIKGYNL